MKSIQYTMISAKGQITIPKAFRDQLKVKIGDEVTLVMRDDGILVKPKITMFGTLRGLLKDEIDITKAMAFIENERKSWHL